MPVALCLTLSISRASGDTVPAGLGPLPSVAPPARHTLPPQLCCSTWPRLLRPVVRSVPSPRSSLLYQLVLKSQRSSVASSRLFVNVQRSAARHRGVTAAVCLPGPPSASLLLASPASVTYGSSNLPSRVSQMPPNGRGASGVPCACPRAAGERTPRLCWRPGPDASCLGWD